jgi:PAS domain S-box-containing protein
VKTGRSCSIPEINKAVLLIVLILLLTAPFSLAQPSAPRVLILNSYHQGDNWPDDEMAGILDALKKVYPDLIPSIEYLDTKRFPGSDYQKKLQNYLKGKYLGRSFDLVFALDNPALDLALILRPVLFPKVPLVFCGINDFHREMLQGQKGITGVLEELDIEGTIRTALNLQPAAKKFLVINDFTQTGRLLRSQAEEMVPLFKDRVQFIFNQEEPWPALEERLKRLGGDTLILLMAYITDSQGRTFPRQESTRRICAAAPVPVFGLTGARFGQGIIGGIILSGRHHGAEAAELGLRILKGEDPDAIPIKASPSLPMFDFPVLKRFGISLQALPPGSLIINRPVSFWEKNRAVLWPVALIMGTLLFLLCVVSLTLIRIRKAEALVRESEEEFRLAFENANIGMCLVDLSGRFKRVNEKMGILLGYGKTELEGMTVAQVTLAEDVAPSMAFIQGALEGLGDRKVFEKRYRHKEGHTVWTVVSSSLVRNRAGRPDHFITQVQDITDRKRAETALLEGEARYRHLFNNAQVGLFRSVLEDGRIITCNEKFAQSTGYDRPEECAADYVAIEHYIDPLRRAELLQRLSTEGRVDDFEAQVTDKNGNIRWASLSARVYLRDGFLEGAVIDITDKKLADEEIRNLNEELESRVVERTAELTALNRELEGFSYSISHDLRAPLRHLTGFAVLLQNRSEAVLDEKSRHYLTVISESSLKMAGLIDDILSFVRMGRQEMARTAVDMDTLLEEVRQTFQLEDRERKIEWRLQPLPPVDGDPVMLKIVLTNLVDNALKFTAGREQAVIEIGHLSEEGREDIFYVRDNGAGFDMKYQDKLFGLFHRLHRDEEFKGTGLGLAIIQRIIQRHGGRVWAEAVVDGGATFYFALPGKGDKRP